MDVSNYPKSEIMILSIFFKLVALLIWLAFVRQIAYFFIIFFEYLPLNEFGDSQILSQQMTWIDWNNQ